jgi:hypothetical protein
MLVASMVVQLDLEWAEPMAALKECQLVDAKVV